MGLDLKWVAVEDEHDRADNWFLWNKSAQPSKKRHSAIETPAIVMKSRV